MTPPGSCVRGAGAPAHRYTPPPLELQGAVAGAVVSAAAAECEHHDDYDTDGGEEVRWHSRPDGAATDCKDSERAEECKDAKV